MQKFEELIGSIKKGETKRFKDIKGTTPSPYTGLMPEESIGVLGLIFKLFTLAGKLESLLDKLDERLRYTMYTTRVIELFRSQST